MKTGIVIVLWLAALPCAALAADAPPTEVVVFNRAQVDDAFAKALPLLVTSSYKIQTGNRAAPGIVEVHERDTDIFYVTEGSAILTTGGTATATKTTTPGEIRGERIVGGVRRKLTKGDLIVIPAGVPHWFSDVSGTFLYLVIKVTR